MFLFDINDKMIDDAKKYYDFKILNNSFTFGSGNIYGALGELAFISFFGLNSTCVANSKDYDILTPWGEKVEIKTKQTSVPPLPSYLCSVAKDSFHQNPDCYFFVRIDKSMKQGWLLGYSTKKNFFSDGFYAISGETESGTGFVFKTDCMNLPISKLISPQDYFFKNKKLDVFLEDIWEKEEDWVDFETKKGVPISLSFFRNGTNIIIEEEKRGRVFNGYIESSKSLHFLFESYFDIDLFDAMKKRKVKN
jgi:hypothetical protein